MSGGYKITASGATSSNYKITFVNGTLTVTPAPLTIAAVNAQKQYGAALPNFAVTYNQFVNGDNAGSLTGTLAFDTPASSASSVAGGPYTITPKGLTSTNYNITFAAGKLTVTPAPLTITANDATKVYGAGLPSFTAKYETLVNNDTPGSLIGTLTFASSASASSSVLGSPYTITPSGVSSTNYTVTFVAGKLSVTPAPLVITADNKQKVYGAPVPGNTVSFNSFVLGESSSVLGGALVFNAPATQSSTVAGGPYPSHRVGTPPPTTASPTTPAISP